MFHAPRLAATRASYLPHVDGLRAIAVILVIANHAFAGAVPGGFIGVDMFFVISGFIITRQILSTPSHRPFVYRDFLVRRVRRLAPAFFLCLGVVTALGAALLLPDALSDYARNLIAAALFFANIFNLHHSSYFSAPSDAKPLLHLWSLSIEDQFYLTWPLLLGLLRRITDNRLILGSVIGGAGLVSLGYAHAIVGEAPDFAFYVIFPRCFPLLFGCALAIFTQAEARLAPLPFGLEIAGLVAVVGSAFALSGASAYPGLVALPVCLGTLALIAGGLRRASPVAAGLGTAGLVLIGRMSYSLYLWHWPLLALARYRLGRPLSVPEAAALVAAAAVIAALSWRFIERPFRVPALRPGRNLGLAALAMAVTWGLGLTIIGDRGWPWRLDPQSRAFFLQMASSNPYRAACDGSALAFANDARCAFGRASEAAPFDIAIFGDSNADHFVPMVAALAAKRNLRGRQVTQSTCAPLIGAARARPAREEEACTTYQATMLAFLARNPHLKLAILSGVWSGYYGPLTRNRLDADAPGASADFESFVTATVRFLRARGIKVLIIGQIPHFRRFPLPCFLNAVETDTREGACGMKRAEVEADLGRSLAIFRQLAREDAGVTLFDPMSALCGPSLCSPFKDGVFAYHDFGHLNAIGSAALANYAALPEDL